MENVAVETSAQKLSRVLLGLVPVLMLVYPALRAAGADKVNVGTAMFSGAAAYVLAIYLFWGIVLLTFRGQLLWVAAGALGGTIVAVVQSSADNIWFVLIGWLAVLMAGVVAGRLLAAGHRLFRVYATGLIVLAALTALAWMPTWQEVYKAGAGPSEELVKRFEQSLAQDGYTAEQIAEFHDAMLDVVTLTVRLTPASTVMSAILQFTLGLFWVMSYLNRRNPAMGVVKPFVLWKMPFGVMPVLAVAILARLVGTEVIKMAADNVLVVLSIFYSVCGLAFLEYQLQRFHVSRFVRVLFYILLFVTHVIGLLATVLLGVVDSFTDWRKAESKISLEN